MRKITLLGIFFLLSFFTSQVKAEIYFDLTTVGGTKVMDWAAVATENAKAQADRWLTLVNIVSGTSGKCGTASNTFDIKTGSSRSITFYLAKCDNLTISANIASGRGLLVNINDAATNIQLDGTGACKDYLVPINSETNVKIKVTALTSSSSWTSFFTFNYTPKVPSITSFVAANISATINETSTPKTITAELPYGTDLTSITPTVVIGGTATGYSPSGSQNFSSGIVTYSATDGNAANDVNYNVSLTTPVTIPDPTLTLKTGNTNQQIKAGTAATDIVYTLVNASGATVSGLPAGLTSNFVSTGANQGTFTISGSIDNSVTPAITNYTVTATPISGYSGSNTITANGTFDVKASNANNILYIATDATTISNDKFLEQLTLSRDYFVTKRAPINPSTSVDYSTVNLVVLHESLTGGDATTTTNEVSTIKSLDKPILNTKSYFYTYSSTASSNRWGWGTPAGLGSPKGIKVIQPNHPVFDGLNKAADSIYIYNTATSKNIQTTTIERIGGYNIANGSVGNTGVAIHDLPGSVRIGTGSTSKYLMISLFNGKYNDLTEDGLKLLDNAVKYLLTGTQFAPSLQISTFTAAGVTGSIDNTVGSSTISVLVPMGTDRSAITPVITLEGIGTTVTPSGAQNFTTGSINYTVTDGINSKVYAVSVLEQGTGLHNTLTGITFDGQTIHNNNHQMITVFDATGRLVVTSDKDVNMNGYAKGIYMILGEKGQLKIAYTK